MTPWPIQRNVYTLVPQVSTAMNRSSPQDNTHILTTHNTNTPRLTSSLYPPLPSLLPTASTLTPFDDSLTNLSWLHDINILKRTMPTINSSSTSMSNSNKRKEQFSPSSSSSTAVYHPNDISDSSDLTVHADLDDDDRWRLYKSNPQAKPIYSYSQLILLALKQSGYEKMTLQMIYEWIVEHFPYFKKMEPTWQNSIRHNLSLNKYFIKVPRTKKEAGTGKGGFWKLSPDYERQRSLLHASSSHTTQPKRPRPSKRSSNSSSLNQLISDNVKSTRMSHENVKLESWIDPILPCIVSKSQSPLHCHTVDRAYVRMPSSFLSPTSSPETQTVSPFHPRQMSDFSAILTPSPSSSPSPMSSSISKANFSSTKFDETDMLLLDSSTFDWDAYLCETPNDMDVQPLLTNKTEQDLFNDFNAALTDLTSSAAAANENDSNAFDAFDYANKSGSFQSLFDDDDHPQESLVQSSTLSVKGAGIKRPLWWMNNETSPPATTKLPSLETAFDLKLPK